MLGMNDTLYDAVLSSIHPSYHAEVASWAWVKPWSLSIADELVHDFAPFFMKCVAEETQKHLRFTTV